MDQNIYFKGDPIVPGVQFGEIALMQDIDDTTCDHRIPADALESEIKKLHAMIQSSIQQFELKKMTLESPSSDVYLSLLNVLILSLKDPIMIQEIEQQIREKYWNVTSAIKYKINKIQEEHTSEKNIMSEKIKDILSAWESVLKQDDFGFETFKAGIIVVAKKLSMASAIHMTKKNIVGIALFQGSSTSHASLVLRNHHWPYLIQLKEEKNKFKMQNHMQAIIDAEQGILILSPSDQIQKKYKKKQSSHKVAFFDGKDGDKMDIQKKFILTQDKNPIKLLFNVSTNEDITSTPSPLSDGVGLCRTEYLFMNRHDIPTEQEQYESYMSIAKKFKNKILILRTVDISTDKVIQCLSNHGETISHRGIHLYHKYPELLLNQIKAMIRVAEYTPVQILFPMIRTVRDFMEIKAMIVDIQPTDPSKRINITYGAMIEVPSIVFDLDMLVQKVDFLSVGTNDLLQYFFALDRETEDTSKYAKYPSFLSLLQMIVNIAHKNNKKVSLCGNIASDITMLPWILGIGFDYLSIVPGEIYRIVEKIESIHFLSAQSILKDYCKAKNIL